MRLAVLSDERARTGATATGGLGRSMYAIAAGLAQRGHDVTLYAVPGSHFEWGTVKVGGFVARETPGYDAVLDGTHRHLLAAHRPEWPVVHRLGDREYRGHAPNAVVASRYMRRYFPQARIVPTGITERPLLDCERESHLLFMALNVPHKGGATAADVGETVGREVLFYGPGWPNGPVLGTSWQLALQSADALLYPSTIDAAPRTPLEAAMMGTPTLCLDLDGAQEHVEHCVSGFVCADAAEMADAVPDVALLDRQAMRAWVLDTHGYARMIDGYEAALHAVADGERW